METEITNSASMFFVAFVGIMALNVALMFFAYMLGNIIGKIFDE